MDKDVAGATTSVVPELNWPRLHSSIYRQGNSAPHSIAAKAVANDAYRFRCPITKSFVLLTDDETVTALHCGRARLRCVACGELHLVRTGPR
ncbi:MAG TPA: hypothetical protein VFX37_04565 [Pseudolabrys sp.]|nr:hypothetical protein [Pseudolabrys sp.]